MCIYSTAILLGLSNASYQPFNKEVVLSRGLPRTPSRLEPPLSSLAVQYPVVVTHSHFVKLREILWSSLLQKKLTVTKDQMCLHTFNYNLSLCVLVAQNVPQTGLWMQTFWRDVSWCVPCCDLTCYSWLLLLSQLFWTFYPYNMVHISSLSLLIWHGSVDVQPLRDFFFF